MDQVKQITSTVGPTVTVCAIFKTEKDDLWILRAACAMGRPHLAHKHVWISLKKVFHSVVETSRGLLE